MNHSLFVFTTILIPFSCFLFPFDSVCYPLAPPDISHCSYSSHLYNSFSSAVISRDSIAESLTMNRIPSVER